MPSSLAARARWKSIEGSWRKTPVRMDWNLGFAYSDGPE